MSVDFERGVEAERARNGYEDMDEAPRELAKMRGPMVPGANEKWYVLPEPYDTTPPMRILIWVNYPNKFTDDIGSGDDDLMYAAMSKIVLGHNDWIDQDGKPYPMLKRGDADVFRRFWREISNELALVISTMAFQAAGKASTSLLNRDQRRRGR